MPSIPSRLVASLAAIVVGLAALSGLPAAPANAAVPSSCENSGCPDPTGWATERWKAHAGYPSHGGTVDGMNCTNYAAWRVIKNGVASTLVAGLGNASTWDTRAAAKGLKVNSVPAVGAIAQWNSNHVAYVEQVNSNGTIVISESNTWMGTSSNRTWLRHRVVTTSTVDAFIHFRSPIDPTPKSIVSPGDFDRDGADDLIVVRRDGGLMLYRGDGAGGLVTPGGSRIGTSTGWAKFVTVFSPGDFNGDKRSDLITVGTDGKLYLYRGASTGAFASRLQIATGTSWNTAKFVFSPGDFTGDKRSDVLAVLPDGRLRLNAGNGTGQWSGSSRIIGSGFETATLVTSPGDVNGDGRSDVVAVYADGSMKLFAGNGRGGLADPAGVDIGTGWSGLASLAGRGDLNGDGLADLIALRSGSSLLLHAGDGTGGFAAGASLGATW